MVLDPYWTCVAITPPAPPAWPATSACAGASPQGRSAPACTRARPATPAAAAELMPAHPAMLFPVPAAIDDEHAVSPTRARSRSTASPGTCRPRRPGAGVGGRLARRLRRRRPAALHPDVEVGVRPVRRPGRPRRPAGAPAVFRPGSQIELVETAGGVVRGVLYPTMEGLGGVPMCHPGGIDVAYDTVGKPETFEVEVRTRARGTLVKSGVHPRAAGSGARSTSRRSTWSAPTPSASRWWTESAARHPALPRPSRPPAGSTSPAC